MGTITYQTALPQLPKYSVYYNCYRSLKLGKLWRRAMLFASLNGPLVSFTGQIEHKGDKRRRSNELFTFNLS
jgi:hypothetical protein